MARKTTTDQVPRQRAPRITYRHPVNQELYGEPPLGARVADTVTTFLGSWKFLVIQSIVVVLWIAGNIVLLFHFDPFPFILLNLAFSTQAAYAAPLILLAGNRQSVRDRLTLEHAADQADVEEKQNEQLLRDDKEILEHVVALEKRILELEEKILTEMRVGQGGSGGPGGSGGSTAGPTAG
jgi:uncharacterized membrane protein